MKFFKFSPWTLFRINVHGREGHKNNLTISIGADEINSLFAYHLFAGGKIN